MVFRGLNDAFNFQRRSKGMWRPGASSNFPPPSLRHKKFEVLKIALLNENFVRISCGKIRKIFETGTILEDSTFSSINLMKIFRISCGAAEKNF